MAGTSAQVLCHAPRGAVYLGRNRRHPAQPLRKAVLLMGRTVFEPLVLFLSPFAIYPSISFCAPVTRSRSNTGRAGVMSVMTLVGLAAAVLGLVAINAFAPRGRGLYVPAHVENGMLVPGRFE